jgi:F-type H+-transporting ATPase subunit alpha
MALLKQPQYSPYPIDEMTVSLWTGTTGRLDKVPVEDVLRFEREFIDFVRRSHADILAGIRDSLDFSEDTEAALTKAYEEFLGQFETSEGGGIHVGSEAAVDATTDEELEQEQIVKQKRG